MYDRAILPIPLGIILFKMLFFFKCLFLNIKKKCYSFKNVFSWPISHVYIPYETHAFPP